MKLVFKKMATSQTDRIYHWLKLIVTTSSAQFIVQIFAFLCGIVVIRLLPIQEYALYTLANTMLGMMTLLADGGIATGVMFQGGKVWQDKVKLGKVIATGMFLRREFSLFSLVISIPILLCLLYRHNADWLMSGLIVTSLVITFLVTLSSSLLEIAPKINQDIAPLQKIQIITTAGRLILLVPTLFIYPLAAVAIICAGCTQFWSNLRMRKISDRYADRSQQPVPEIRNEIITTVKRVMPGALYYSISGQLTVWLISIFGTTEGVAQIGALSRLAVLLTILSVLIGSLIIPRYARLPINNKLLVRRFIQIQVILLVFTILITSLIWLFPHQILWILGKDYKDLSLELTVIAAGSCMGLLAGTAYGLNSVRNLFVPPLVIWPFLIFAQILFLICFRVDTILMAGIYALVMQLLAYLLHLSFGIFIMVKKNTRI
ncbi:MAG: polysaccharide biosynthesis protein [Cytophaga sp.]|nr:polysaccharide biosynthesis protein [Undibacterium sp.]